MIPGIVSAPLLASEQGMTAIATPSSVNKAKSTRLGGALTVTTPSTTVTVTGGTAPYSHSWATTNPDASAVSASAATTKFEATIDPDTNVDALFIDTVTDANGVVTTAECEAHMSLVSI